jgi:hypothetical protein
MPGARCTRSRGEPEYFCERDWTTQIRLIWFDKFAVAREDGVFAAPSRFIPALNGGHHGAFVGSLATIEICDDPKCQT